MNTLHWTYQQLIWFYWFKIVFDFSLQHLIQISYNTHLLAILNYFGFSLLDSLIRKDICCFSLCAWLSWIGLIVRMFAVYGGLLCGLSRFILAFGEGLDTGSLVFILMMRIYALLKCQRFSLIIFLLDSIQMKLSARAHLLKSETMQRHHSKQISCPASWQPLQQ